MNTNTVNANSPSWSPESWLFEVGDMVTHQDQPLPSKVLWRTRTSRGRELYALRSFRHEDMNRDRLIMGSVLRPIDEAAWDVCLLKGTGLLTGPVAT